MHIFVDVTHFYDWDADPKLDKVDAKTFKSLVDRHEAVVLASGQRARRVVREAKWGPLHIQLPDSDIERMIADNEAAGGWRLDYTMPETAIAEHLERTVYWAHHHPAHRTRIEVPGDKELTEFLHAKHVFPPAIRKKRMPIEGGALMLGNPVPMPFGSSLFSTEVRGADGIKHPRNLRPNLRTTAGLDWENACLFAVLGDNGTTSVAPTATTATDSTKAWTVNQWANYRVVMGQAMGTILSNTATVLTIARWETPSSPGGAAAATPASGAYSIVPGQATTGWLALSTDATAPAAGDTTLTGELTTNGLARAIATYAHTGGASSSTHSKTFTCTGGSQTIQKEADFGAQNGGPMVFESLEPAPAPGLGNTDTLAQTVTISD